MRVWGRVFNSDGTSYTWTEVSTDANGNNDLVMLTALIQCLLLNLGESPFYANFGIPQIPTIISQIYPDYYVNLIQQQYAPNFASLTIARVSLSFPPTYKIQLITHAGVQLSAEIAS